VEPVANGAGLYAVAGERRAEQERQVDAGQPQLRRGAKPRRQDQGSNEATGQRPLERGQSATSSSVRAALTSAR
jgi:hypothetical protein